MILSLKNFGAGYEWRSVGKWPKDFHNKEYQEMYQARQNGLTTEWWNSTLDRLGRWNALRNSPVSKVQLLEKGESFCADIKDHFTRLLLTSGQEPSIGILQWEAIEPIFSRVLALRPGSVMFASKTCHFLLPRVFVVMDNTGTGIFEYEFVWRGLKDEWNRFAERDEAITSLKSWVGLASKEAPYPLYPWETNVMELCLIGYKHRTEHLRPRRDNLSTVPVDKPALVPELKAPTIEVPPRTE